MARRKYGRRKSRGGMSGRAKKIMSAAMKAAHRKIRGGRPKKRMSLTARRRRATRYGRF